MGTMGYTYKIVFPFGSDNEKEVVRCLSLKAYKPLIYEYLKRHNDDIVKIIRGKKEYCSYAFNNGVMYRIGANRQAVIKDNPYFRGRGVIYERGVNDDN